MEQVIKIINGGVSSPKGFKSGGLHCGIRKNKPDLGWLTSDVPTDAFAVYTTNTFQAAPIKVTQNSLESDQKLQAVIVNSGIANACTGERGLKDAYQMREEMAKHLNLDPDQVAVASTGLIGEFLPIEKISSGISKIDQNTKSLDTFERAILTTDTREKKIAVQFEIDGKLVTIGGAAKGSGMINPNMATMLGFITTDALVEPLSLENQLKQLTNQTFNMITVDGDTSTNDTVLVMANGQAENDTLSPSHSAWSVFTEALAIVFEFLAKEIARDGEGATKLIEVQVEGTQSGQEARTIAKSVIGSNLVKTAIHGADANWGRIITAIGYSGVPVNPEEVDVKIGQAYVVKNGLPVTFDQDQMEQYLKQAEVSIYVKAGSSDHKAFGWGCDLSYEYVRINALYRT